MNKVALKIAMCMPIDAKKVLGISNEEFSILQQKNKCNKKKEKND